MFSNSGNTKIENFDQEQFEITIYKCPGDGSAIRKIIVHLGQKKPYNYNKQFCEIQN